MSKVMAIIALLSHLGLADNKSEMAKKFDDAQKKIVRSEPREFKQLPADIVSRLEELKCQVPQSGPQSNVIHGSFAKVEQLDWALLCSRDGHSSIHIFWGGPARCADQFENQSDKSYLQAMGGDGIQFSRQIGVAKPTRAKAKHDGIEDAFLEKASTIWVCRNGKWQSHLGAD